MPRLKQPIALKSLAFDVLVTHSFRCCHTLIANNADLLTRIRKGVADIKHYVYHHVPGTLFAEFCMRFLELFDESHRMVLPYSNIPSSSHTLALEIMMDVKMVGLSCAGSIVGYIDAAEVHRIQGLKIMDLRKINYGDSILRSLGNFHLQDLTTFILPRFCTDGHLTIIGSRCLKLQVLRVENSAVTDKGMRAVSSCSDLRVIDIRRCYVSDERINKSLNIHKKLEELHVSVKYHYQRFNIPSRSISSVCPSMKRFLLNSNSVTDAHLRSVVAIFPNLTYLQFGGKLTADLRILNGLKNLTELKFNLSRVNLRMENLKQLLMDIGENISVLTLQSCQPIIGVTQNDLNFIFKVCGNIEYLGFDFIAADRSIEKLVIPSFKKLKALSCIAVTDELYEDSSVRLEFGVMLALETLRIHRFRRSFDTIESIVLDDERFPNLTMVRTLNKKCPVKMLHRIYRIVKHKNLDFSLMIEGRCY